MHFMVMHKGNKCTRTAQHLKNRSVLLEVDGATLPPSGTETQCRQEDVHYHHLQGVDIVQCKYAVLCVLWV